MNQTEITENNKIIAEWMGLKCFYEHTPANEYW